MTLILATNNRHKLEEIREIFKDLEIEIKSLSDLNFIDKIKEIGRTIEENSLLKAYYVWMKTGGNVIADDTGLEVDSLNGEPGVHTARYANTDENVDEANMDKLLSNLANKEVRIARFKTVITFITEKGDLYQFEGTVKGNIAMSKAGSHGFGYDPIFIPEGYSKTFAELGEEIKNTISHRKRAIDKLREAIFQISM